MLYDLALIFDLYYNLFYIDNQLFIYLLVCMPNRKVFYFVFIDVQYLLLFIILNILLLIDSLLELHRISVFVFIHLLLTNLYQNFIIIYTFLNLYLNMLDVNILLMFFAYYLKMMLIIFQHLFVIIIQPIKHHRLLLLNIEDFLFFINLFFFLYFLLVSLAICSYDRDYQISFLLQNH